uniref:Uncharacterized protein n=1 Tax=Arundo donax TaxID=35708 RepID=A0A0A9FG60_ARUDO
MSLNLRWITLVDLLPLMLGLNCTSFWGFAVHLTKYLKNILMEDDRVVIEFMGFLITNSLLLCGSFHLTVTSLCKMLSELYHKQMGISLI